MDVGTSLPVATTADQWPVVVGGMGAPVKERDKAAPTGEQTFASGCILWVQRKDGSVSPDKTASVHVIKRADTYEYGTFYEARGRVWVQPYESNERTALSITVEQLVPVGTGTGTASTAGKAARAGKDEAA